MQRQRNLSVKFQLKILHFLNLLPCQSPVKCVSSPVHGDAEDVTEESVLFLLLYSSEPNSCTLLSSKEPHVGSYPIHSDQ